MTHDEATSWCSSCGQELPEGHDHVDSQWLAGQAQEAPQHRPGAGRSRRGDKRLIYGLLGLVAAWAAFVGIGQLTSPDEAIDEQAAAEIADRLERQEQEAAAEEAAEREAAEAEDADESELATEVEGDYTAADAAPGFPVQTEESEEFDDGGGLGRSQRDDFIEGSALEERTAVTVQVDRLKRQLARRDSAAFIAYDSADGLVLIDLREARVRETRTTATQGNPAPGVQLFRSGPTTFSIDTETLETQLLGRGSRIVVSQTRDGNSYSIGLGQAQTYEVLSDGEVTFQTTPLGGFLFLPVDGLGLLAVPKGPTGESLIAGVDGLSQLSPNRIIAGTASVVLEQVCDAAGACGLELVDLETQQRTVVPEGFLRFGDRYVVSPNGLAVLRYSPEGFAEVFDTTDNSISWVIGAGMRDAAWGPNSDFIVWFDEIGNPELKVMFPDERDWLTIDLRDLAAPLPIDPSLIAFSYQGAAAEAQID